MNPLPIVSVTEVQMFRECRRKWHLSSLEHLVPNKPNINLWFGEGIHAALEKYWEDMDVEAAGKQLVLWYLSQEEDLKASYGDEWPNQEETYVEKLVMAQQMLRNYDRFCMTEEAEAWIAIEVEKRVRIPIRSALDGRTLKDTPTLSAKIDLVAMTAASEIAVVDHKTMAQKYFQTGESLDLDEQLTGYAYVYWRVHNSIPTYVIYDVLVKKVPSEPVKLKYGGLSVNKTQSTTYDLYKQAMQEESIKITPEYQMMLDILQEKGWSDYFYREVSYRNEHQLKQYEQRLYHTYKDMREAALDPMKLAYAMPGPMKCRNCPYIKVCHAIEDGGDYQALIDNNFTSKPRDITGELINDTEVGLEDD